MARPRRGQGGSAGISVQVRTAEDGARGVGSGPNHGDRGVKWTEEQGREVGGVITFFRRAARDHPRDARV